jgi:hypothetical protein
MGRPDTTTARGRVVTLPVRAPRIIERAGATPASDSSERAAAGLGGPQMAPFGVALSMADAYSRMLEQWVEFQMALWQPWIDWQAGAAMAWASPWMLGPASPWVVRGQEQLA